MENQQIEITETEPIPIQERRRNLLPWWIKTFVWIFLVFGVLAPICLILGLFGFQLQLDLYGLETNDPTSYLAFLLTGIFFFKGVTAFGLWTEKDWAIFLGYADALFGIGICVFVTLIYPFIDGNPGFHVSFRLELLLLFPFLFRLEKIKKDWNRLAVTTGS